MNENPNQVQGEEKSHATDKPMQENTKLEQNSVSEDTTVNTPVVDAANQTVTSQSENEVSESDTDATEPIVPKSDTEESEPIDSKSDIETTETIASEPDSKSDTETTEPIASEPDSKSDTETTEPIVSELDTETAVPIATEPETKKTEPTVMESEAEKTEPIVSETETKEVEPTALKIEEREEEKNSATSVDDTSESDDIELEEEDEEEEEETEDISSLSKTELFEKLTYIVENKPVNKVYQIVEDIRVRYNEIVEEENEKEREEFVSEGNDEADFIPSEDSLKEQFYNLIENYKYKLKDFREQVEKERDENLIKKQEIIKAIENLVNSEESLNKTFSDFHKLQEEWRSIGLVPQSATKHLYETYHHHVERFYDFIKINKELRDLDFKKNLEQKLELCEKAERLIVEPSIVKAFKQLQEYHKQWREIGPVSRDKKEEIWDRFKEATAKVNQRHREHFVTLKEEQENNLKQKRALIAKVQEINKLTLVKPKKWEDKAKDIIETQNSWRLIGFAPKKENNELFEQFKTECDKFFNAKRAYFEERRKEEQNNLQLKIDLCVQAESLKDSTEWKQTTEEYIKLQKAWKEIGPVPRKHSETVWQRFRTACDAFFNSKSEHFGNIDKEQAENLTKKLELIEKVKAFELTGDDEADIQALSDYQTSWTEIGFVPYDKKNKIQKEFRAALNVHYDKLNVSPKPIESFKGKSKGWGDSPKSKARAHQERNRLATKIRDLENEISLYENNIGFFSKSANADAMIRDIEKKIEKAKQTIVELKEKLEEIDSSDNED